MLQVGFIRDHKEEVISRLSKRIDDPEKIVNDILSLDISRRDTQTQLDNISSELNIISKEIGILFKSGQSKKATVLKQKTQDLKEQKSVLTELLNNTTTNLNNLLYKTPNLPHSLVPKGNSDKDNEEVFRSGKTPDLNDDALPHWDLAKKFDIIDFELGNKITGAGFPVYKGKGARLQRALINYFLEKNTNAWL
jgi:seryl-tRNA synthetase